MLKGISKKKWLLGSGIVTLGVGIALFSWYFFFNTDTVKAEVVLSEIDMGYFPKPAELHVRRPLILINGIDIARLTREERAEMIESIVQSKEEKLVTANYQDLMVTSTLGNLGVQLESGMETALDQLEMFERELETKSSFELRFPFVYTLDFTYCVEMLGWWTQSIERQLNVAPVEPSITKVSRGNFIETEGQSGRRVVTSQFESDVAAVFQDLTQSDMGVDVVMETAEPTRDTSLFGTVDTMIARAESSFSRAEAGRARNVDRGAQLVSGTLLMPGEKFSFNNLVYPVTTANGFGSGTVFRQGRVDQGIGGGLCQVSSTVYWAQLRTGIPTVFRQGHSRPVFYVPGGLDATMYIGLGDFSHKLGLDETVSFGLIDYTFVNTLDYPLYLNAFTQGGTLTVEFWSNSEAQNGLTFEPRTTRVATTATNKSYDTFLRTYNAAGQFISEEFLHRSTYRTN